MSYLSYYGKINESYRNDSVPNAFKMVHNKSIHPERLTKLLFTDAAYVENEVNSNLIWSQLFELASSIQNLDVNLSLYDLFTKEECYEQWLCNNVDSYMSFGHSPWTKGSVPYTQSNLLKNILNIADSIIATGKNAVTLRFGHDMFLMPLACLMELGTCGLVIDNADELADKWQDYNIFPMGGNIQMIFFRKNNSNDILVKVLLNELEVNLPVKSEFAPYYHWSELEAYYRNVVAQ